jgi:hypothetical protein
MNQPVSVPKPKIANAKLFGLLAMIALTIPTPVSAGDPSGGVVSASPHALVIGPYRTRISNGIEDLVASFGTEYTCSRKQVRWQKRGVTAYFDYQGGPNACTSGKAVVVVVGKGWRTSRGLRVGQPAAAIHRLYATAKLAHALSRPHSHSWWNLGVRRVTVHGLGYGCGTAEPDGIPCGQLLALVRQGRIAALAMDVGVHVG